MKSSTRRVWAHPLAVLLAVATAGGACSKGENLSSSGPLKVSIAFTHPCLPVGGHEVIETKAVPGASVTYAFVYADGAVHGDAPTGTTGENGKFSANWEVPDDAPIGKGTLTVLAVAGKRTAKRPIPFTVVERGTSCP